MEKLEGWSALVVGAALNEQLAVSFASEQGYEQGLQDEPGAAGGTNLKVVAASRTSSGWNVSDWEPNSPPSIVARLISPAALTAFRCW